MNVVPATDLRAHLSHLLAQAAAIAIPDERGKMAVVLERPKQIDHGDYSSNLALQAAKSLKRNPREIAEALVRALPSSPWLAKVEIAGAGFVNLFLTHEARRSVVTPRTNPFLYPYENLSLYTVYPPALYCVNSCGCAGLWSRGCIPCTPG